MKRASTYAVAYLKTQLVVLVLALKDPLPPGAINGSLPAGAATIAYEDLRIIG